MEIMAGPNSPAPGVGEYWRKMRPSNNRVTLPIIKAVKVAFAEKGYIEREAKMQKGRELVGHTVLTYDDYITLLEKIDQLLPPLEQTQIPL